MERWFFELLGGVNAQSDSRRLDDLMGKKPGAVLALLALSPGRSRPREEIVDLIWPDVELDDARNRFRLVLFGLRKLLEPPGVEPGSVLIGDRTKIGIAAGHTSDVALFQQALRSAALAAEPAQQARHLREALALYKGEFAPGFYLDVLLTERQRLATLAEGASQKLSLLERAEPLRPATAPDIPLIPPFVPAKDRFFGRKDEQEHLKKLVERNRLVTILGPGGIGKTRLALKITQTVTLGEKTRFVPLATLQNGGSIPDILVASLNLPPSSEPALARLKAAFAREETLLALDNIEHLLDRGGSEAISSLLESLPNVRLLATSRVRTNLPEECLYPLGPLAEEDAVALFVDRAQLTRFDFALTEENASAVRELCRRLDGLPLAIELATARIAVLTPAQILERLSRRFDLLTDKRKDREERHRSLRAALDWGWGLLSPEVQRFFAQLSLFRGSFSLEAVEAITGEPLAIDYLQNLLEASFLLAETDSRAGAERRFYLLETLREYGSERLEEWNQKEKSGLFDRFGKFFLERATVLRRQLADNKIPVIVGLFRKDMDNFSAAIDYNLNINIINSVDICIKTNIFWIYSFSYRENVVYLEKILEKLKESSFDYEHELMSMYDVLGLAYNYVNMPEKSYEYTNIALDYARKRVEKGDAEGIPEKEKVKRYKKLSGALHNLSLSLDHSPEEQERLLLEAVMLNRKIGNDSWLALNLSRLYYLYEHLALKYADSEDCFDYLKKALLYADEAHSISRSLKNDFYLPHHIGNLSSALIEFEVSEKSLGLLYESLILTVDFGMKDDFVRNLLRIHCFALKISDFENAVRFLGAEENFMQQWNVEVDEDKAIYFYVTLQPLRDALPQTLGKERYEALYRQGVHATIDTIKQWAAAIRLDPAV